MTRLEDKVSYAGEVLTTKEGKFIIGAAEYEPLEATLVKYYGCNIELDIKIVVRKE